MPAAWGRRGRAAGLARTAAWFLPVWLPGAVLNMHIGVSRAGYAVRDEGPVFLLVFAVPAALALTLWWRAGAANPAAAVNQATCAVRPVVQHARRR